MKKHDIIYMYTIYVHVMNAQPVSIHVVYSKNVLFLQSLNL